jgi:hypothetical protein
MTHPTPYPQPKPLNQPKFGSAMTVLSGMITPEALRQFAQDTAGVWLPKAPVSLLRNTQEGNDNPSAQKLNKIQFFEDTFLEFFEDGAFYFTIPVVGTVMGALISKLHGGVDYKEIGKSWKDLSVKDVSRDLVSTRLLGAKSGAIIGALGSAFAFEYMVQHWKNLITAKKFHTTNFTGVAGLESSRTKIAPGEDDPVAKASKRGKQVGAFWLASLGVALATPTLVTKWAKNESLHQIPKILRYLNFGSSEKSLFDTHKGFQGLLVMVGLASYLDAARDKLEFKEQATRLSVVIPYLLFGQAVAGNLLAKGLERIPFYKDTKGNRVSMQELNLDMLDLGNEKSMLKAMWKKGTTPESVLRLDLSKTKNAFAESVKKLQLENRISSETAQKMIKLHGPGMYIGSLALGAAVCGIGINLIAYHQTNQRHKKQLAARIGNHPNPSIQSQQGQTVFQSYGGFAAQGKPLEDSATAAANVVPRLQTPFQGARLSGNPYGYGQWRV